MLAGIFGLMMLQEVSSTYSTVQSGDWDDSSTWSGGNIPPTDIEGEEITITHNVTLSDDLKIDDEGSVTVTDANLFLTEKKLEIEEGSLIVTNGNLIVEEEKIELKDSESLLRMSNGSLTIGKKFEVKEGMISLANVCLTTGDKFTISEGNDTLINVQAVIGNEVGGKLEIKDEANVYVENSGFHLPNGEFKLKDDATLSGTIDAIWLEDGELEDDTDEGSWTANVSAYCVSDDVEVSSSYLPASEGCDNIASYFSGSCNGSSADMDGDGVADTDDLDDDNDGILDTVEGDTDTDGDGVVNRLDVDSDNDGILDNIEAQATGKSGTQTFIPSPMTVDASGVPTAYFSYDNYDTDNSTVLSSTYGITPYDHDGDGTPDYLDTDSDGDGDPDVDEAWDSNLDGDGSSDYTSSTDADGDGLLSCFDSDDADSTVHSYAVNPPVDNGFEDGVGNGATSASSFSGLDGSSVFFFDVFPNNSGDNSDIQPDWRDDNSGCVVGAGLQYPITGTDGIYTGGAHASDPTKQTGAIRVTDYCDGLVTAGWRYYFDPINPTKVLFSIAHDANTTQIDYIEMRRDTSSARQVTNPGTGDGFFVMARDWFVQTVNDDPLTSPVSIRFYFDPADSTAMQDAADAYASAMSRVKGDVVWFKTDNQFTNEQISASDGLSTQTGYVTMTPGSYGVESSLHYVQFDNVPGFSGGGLGVGVDGSLPVEWAGFTAQQEGSDGLLKWATANETNSDFFEVQRSQDGLIFQGLDRVNSVGNSTQTQNYSFVDKGIANKFEGTVYYRLKQVDIDGTFSMSNVVQMRVEQIAAFELVVFPNPVSAYENATVKITNGASQTASLRVISLQGQVLYSQNVPASFSGEMEIPSQNWAKGYYTVSMVSSDRKATRTLAVQ